MRYDRRKRVQVIGAILSSVLVLGLGWIVMQPGEESRESAPHASLGAQIQGDSADSIEHGEYVERIEDPALGPAERPRLYFRYSGARPSDLAESRAILDALREPLWSDLPEDLPGSLSERDLSDIVSSQSAPLPTESPRRKAVQTIGYERTRSVISKYEASVSACFASARYVIVGPSQKISVALVVEPTGRVSGARLLGPESFGAGIRRCLQLRARAMRFPATRGTSAQEIVASVVLVRGGGRRG